MINIIIEQYYFKREEDGKMQGYFLTGEFLSDYSKKLIAAINDIFLDTKFEQDINKVDDLLVSEMYMTFTSSKEELNEKEEFIGVDDLLENKELLKSLRRVDLGLRSVFNTEFYIDEINKLIQMLQLSVQRDLENLLKEKKQLEITFTY